MYKISDDKYIPFKKKSLEYRIYQVIYSVADYRWDEPNPDIKKIKRIINMVKRSLPKQRQEFGPFYEKSKVVNLQNQIESYYISNPQQYDCNGNLKCVCPECKKKFIK